jgi:hypothetical protein
VTNLFNGTPRPASSGSTKLAFAHFLSTFTQSVRSVSVVCLVLADRHHFHLLLPFFPASSSSSSSYSISYDSVSLKFGIGLQCSMPDIWVTNPSSGSQSKMLGSFRSRMLCAFWRISRSQSIPSTLAGQRPITKVPCLGPCLRMINCSPVVPFSYLDICRKESSRGGLDARW